MDEKACSAWPKLRRLALHCTERADSRADITAGIKMAIRMAMIEITTSNSISVKPDRVVLRACVERRTCMRWLPYEKVAMSDFLGPTRRVRDGDTIRGIFQRMRKKALITDEVKTFFALFEATRS